LTAEQLLASQDGLCSVELVINFEAEPSKSSLEAKREQRYSHTHSLSDVAVDVLSQGAVWMSE